MMNNRRFYNFPRITVAVYFTEFESIIVYRGTRRARCLPITSAFENSQPLLLYGANGRVCAIPTYRVYRLYDNTLEVRKIYSYSDSRKIVKTPIVHLLSSSVHTTYHETGVSNRSNSFTKIIYTGAYMIVDA